MTLSKSVSSFLNDFSRRVRFILPQKAVGMYIYGSVALEAFNSNKSDLDFVVFLQEELDKKELRALKELHRQLVKTSPYGEKLDGMYLQENHAGKDNKNQPQYPYCENGKIKTGYWDVNGITWWMIKHRGIDLFGPPAEELDLEESFEQVEKTLDYNLTYYWADKAGSRKNFVKDEDVEFAVLTIARILYSIDRKDIVSKEAALNWLQGQSMEKWETLLSEAKRLRTGNQEKMLYSNRTARAKECRLFAEEMIKNYKESK
ncbi:aminoglycoside adenylyltransferase domain-containing protein [Jeotgalibacillus proteolyticus]|nr:aminoglycoside adenylyltransferase domain-containing protein [Jeotgalibacillus proteolyticus]